MTTSPFACSNPALIAGCCPKLRASEMTFAPGFAPAIRFSRASESSELPSSTKIASYGPGCSATSIRRASSSTLEALL